MRISDWSSDVCSSDLAAFLALQSIGEARILDAENHAMFGVDPFGEGYDHVHQHLVAIGDDERAVHAVVPSDGWPSSLWAAAASVAGGTCNASAHATRRSEEHTSELQSLMRISYAVFCLKKQKI